MVHLRGMAHGARGKIMARSCPKMAELRSIHNIFCKIRSKKVFYVPPARKLVLTLQLRVA